MKTIMVDGREVLVEDQISTSEIVALARPNNDQFPVIARETPGQGAPEFIPVPAKGCKTYDMQNGDRLQTLHQVTNG
jgi:hypothetical protein